MVASAGFDDNSIIITYDIVWIFVFEYGSVRTEVGWVIQNNAEYKFMHPAADNQFAMSVSCNVPNEVI